MPQDIITKVKTAKSASIPLASVPGHVKNRALTAMASALDSNREGIIFANKRDLVAAQRLVETGRLSKALVKRLKVDDSKIDEMIAGINDVIKFEDPVGKTLSALELDTGLELYQVSCPIGLIGVIFESRPDVVPQIMALCLKSGNATIFKGGSEAAYSNRTIFDILVNAIESTEGMPHGAFALMETREEVNEMLKLDEYINLIIPRGSNEFVKYIQDNTRIPVLGHSDGICHVYVDSEADMNRAIDVCYDAKVQYPAVCNAMETLLVHKDIAEKFLPDVGKKYNEAGVELRCDNRSFSILKEMGFLKAVLHATEEDWRTEYNDLILSIRVVDSLDEGIDHINRYGSHHTDAIVTEDKSNASRFIDLVDSSSVMWNASTRFSDGYRYGKGAEVGISTNKIHARGPVGMEGLLIYKYVLLGGGNRVADYAGANARKFTHRKLNVNLADKMARD
ncbi:glutamate-5-semialdehyde dehydrogenase [Candidatus Methanoperedens nitroreducens]|uniref:Gamma-glutamyl phosphate reductase n=1 Tax=Candidatus Methanoperedens nitratireducens TaxID=1392998 RepID=A0A062V8V0_9EURY|nr:glutamate-5-semialdehyde dehydrogenase [Candidatus Methanoperedens nitroreducens]KCZ71795.1 glutamate-5-semialdehyde dehydrogenase [Candidatus Methanoperedens nitroreducens]MDJ1422231.1 glutamate-5-semialdehyde dehydrogenase [Candidatus Methanoperedens sp.]